jgi:cell division protein FtsA
MANTKNQFLALDIGSVNIKALAGEINRDGVIALRALYKLPSRGMRKGMVSDAAEATAAVNQALVEIRKDFPEAHKRIFMNIGSAHAKVQPSRGIVAVSRADYQIHNDDMMRVEAAVQAVSVPPNRMIVHLINQEYMVDGIAGIKNPLGMMGNRLELQSMIVDVFEPAVKAIMKVVETASGDIEGLIFGPLASSESALSKNQKDLGVALIDIGADTSSLAVYEDGKLAHLAVIPAGSGHVTNDLAIGLKVSIEAAEAIKCSFGYAVAKDIPTREMVDLRKMDSRAKGAVPRRFIAEVIEMRLGEIFESANKELEAVGRAGRLPAGVVLVGGGAKLPGIIELARQELKLPAQIGSPDLARFAIAESDIGYKAEDPEFACALGLMMWGKEHGKEPERESFGAFFKKIAHYFMP